MANKPFWPLICLAEEIHYQDGHGSQSQSDLRPDGRPITTINVTKASISGIGRWTQGFDNRHSFFIR